MNSPQFKAGNVSIFNEKISLNEFKNVELISIFALYFSETLLFLGILLVLFNNLNIISPGSYFGSANWVTLVVFLIGICINFISIPFLYYSSFKHFIKELDFWDRETFWILPMFFFGTFFLCNSSIAPALIMIVLSILIIMPVHIVFVLKSQRVNKKYRAKLANYGQYVMTLKYLSAYYIILLPLLIVFDPLGYVFAWIRLNI